jgi:hypothetical protein
MTRTAGTLSATPVLAAALEYTQDASGPDGEEEEEIGMKDSGPCIICKNTSQFCACDGQHDVESNACKSFGTKQAASLDF